MRESTAAATTDRTWQGQRWYWCKNSIDRRKKSSHTHTHRTQQILLRQIANNITYVMRVMEFIRLPNSIWAKIYVCVQFLNFSSISCHHNTFGRLRWHCHHIWNDYGPRKFTEWLVFVCARTRFFHFNLCVTKITILEQARTRHVRSLSRLSHDYECCTVFDTNAFQY